jgi:hypothetical protein
MLFSAASILWYLFISGVLVNKSAVFMPLGMAFALACRNSDEEVNEVIALLGLGGIAGSSL